MNVSQVHSKINELQTCFRDQQYDDAQAIMQDFLDSFPDYQTPMFMYIRLMPEVDSENPLYLKILELTRHYHQLTYFPGDLVPDWYEKIGTRNIEIVLPVSGESEPAFHTAAAEPQVTEELPVLTDESDIGVSIDHMFPDQVPYEEEPETPSTMFDPHSLADDEPIVAPEPFAVHELAEPATELQETITAELSDLADNRSAEPEILPAFEAVSDDGPGPESDVLNAEIPESELFAEPEPFSTEGFLSDDDNLPSSLIGSGFQQEGDELTGFEDGGTVDYEPDHEQDDEILIASETMANIFAQQGKYDKAIKVYRMLMEEEPEMMDHFLQKVQELQKAGSENNS
ncbi:MAG: tetratricopeptide repeat protein [Bacteroidetes bacterium]|nr:tetratricopeptide repeat protein [Bacteroidota bacterium]